MKREFRARYRKHVLMENKFSDGVHKLIYVYFDFTEPVPCDVYRIKDTYALFGEYEALLKKIEVGQEVIVTFGSERGKHAGRVVGFRLAGEKK